MRVAKTPNTPLWKHRVKAGLSRERVAAVLTPPVSSKTIERWETRQSPVPGFRKAQLEALYNGAIEEGKAAA